MRSPAEQVGPVAGIGEFARVIRLVARPVVIVTVEHEGTHRAMTAGSFVPLSWAIPTISINFANDAQTLTLVRSASHFVVNVVRVDQTELAERMSRVDLDGVAQLDGLDVGQATCGARILSGIIGALECRKTEVLAVVDHTLVLGTVERVYGGDDEAFSLVTRDGHYHELGRALAGVEFVRRA